MFPKKKEKNRIGWDKFELNKVYVYLNVTIFVQTVDFWIDFFFCSNFNDEHICIKFYFNKFSFISNILNWCLFRLCLKEFFFYFYFFLPKTYMKWWKLNLFCMCVLDSWIDEFMCMCMCQNLFIHCLQCSQKKKKIGNQAKSF